MNVESGMLRRQFLAAGTAVAVAGCSAPAAQKQPKAEKAPANRIALLSDLHLPCPAKPHELKAIADINGWTDVGKVVVLGDLCSNRGTDDELKEAMAALAGLRTKPVILPGNHDTLYMSCCYGTGWDPVVAPLAERRRKVERFRRAVGRRQLYFSEDWLGYHLVYLSCESVTSEFETAITDAQLEWLASDLRGNRGRPTIAFFHAPLKGTTHRVTSKMYAEPAGRIQSILRANPQVILWVAGHQHHGPFLECVRNPQSRPLAGTPVLVVHVPAACERGRWSEAEGRPFRYPTQWSRSLVLEPGQVRVETYDHLAGRTLDELELRVANPFA